MKKLLSAILLLSGISTIAQNDAKNKYEEISSKFVDAFNSNDFQKVTTYFNENMLKAVPAEKIEGLYNQLGKINKREFSEQVDGSIVYKVVFENGILDMKIAIDKNDKITGLLFTPHKEKSNSSIIERNITGLRLPFKGEWNVFWGGDTKELNQHIESRAQKNAFDMTIVDSNNKTHTSAGNTNEDYYAFGKEIIAPCDAIVTDVVEGVRDNVPGQMNTIYVLGNTVILKTVNNEYLFFAHFKQGSIQVKVGDKIKTGELLGLCGNSGNSSEPHLHFHIQNTNDMLTATGAKCYFKEIIIKQNGKTEIKTDYSPVKGDLISQK